MSRIHEALKKAEEERAQAMAQGDIEEPGLPAADIVDQSMPLTGAAAISAANMVAAIEAPVGLPPEIAATNQFSFEALAGRCRHIDWLPDATSLAITNDSHAPGAEEFRTLRSRLFQIRQKQNQQILLVSSALQGEGKSFVSLNLAQIIVRQAGRKVLLVDADLRRPQLHLRLGTQQTPGLADYLRGDADEFAVVQKGPIDNLLFIPGGEAGANPAELIAGPRLKMLMRRLKGAFDWIIMDSPPAVPVSDASILANVCDGVVLVVQAAVTPLHAVQKAKEEFRNKPLLGVVLNRVDRNGTYPGYYYYGYGNNQTQKGRSER